MTRIGLISDTHGTFDDTLKDFLKDVDEIWHAGDFGNIETLDAIAAFKPLKAVCGNVDGGIMRRIYPMVTQFKCENVSVLMTHIGGYPNHYDARIIPLIDSIHPKIFVAGHSHILKIIYDRRKDLLHLNPGGAGIYGIHTVRTALRFTIDGSDIKQMEIGQWPKR